MPVTVYSTPRCVQCSATYRELDKHKIDYRVVDLTADAEAMNLVKSLGYSQAPIVMVEEKHWSGFRPDLISQLV